MRDTDRDLTSVVVVRADSPIRTTAELAGKTIAVGASDSPQATLIPLQLIAESGVAPGKDCEILRHDVLVGKHGDHVGGEREAARALIAGRADAACMIDGNHLAFSREGTLPAGSTRVVAQTAPYDHCNFTVLYDHPEPVRRFSTLLLAMSYDDPSVRGLARPRRVEAVAARTRRRLRTAEPRGGRHGHDRRVADALHEGAGT
jgi:ABC-type phosphate/phosphonate transport system substrate-binding protein